MMKSVSRRALVVVLGVLPLPAGAKTHRRHKPKPLKVQIAKLLADPAVSQAHWGIAVTTIEGKPIYALNEGQLFQPASNNKLFTTAAALALLGPQTTYETKIVGKGVFDGAAKLTGDLVLVGAGDANLSGRALPYISPANRPVPPPTAPKPLRYLEQMADQVANTGLKVVNGNVVGDDTLFPWEPYARDWSIDDAVWGYGAPVSALTINDNQIKVTVTPGGAEGKPATVTTDPDVPYYTLEVAVTTVAAKSESSVQMERAPGGKVLRIYGAIGVDAQPDVEEVAIQDPAEYAAVALKAMLAARGVEVTGKARALHRISSDTQGFLRQSSDPIANLDQRSTTDTANMVCQNCTGKIEERQLASHTSPPLIENLVVTNKVSQNLHAELFLHQLGVAVLGDGSTAQGARVVRAFLTDRVGIDKDDFIFFDGSGLSGHDLVAPRATVKLLQYATTQPWFAGWKHSLPIGGEDGTLAERFPKPPLKDHLFAKTGTLSEARALSGYLQCASGKTVIFSIMVGNHTPRTHADRDAMDKIVAAIAETN